MMLKECEKCDGTGLDLSYFDKMKHVVNRSEIPACEICEGWGEIETKEEQDNVR
jgi:ssDNA-binding Zn-finger/Zn-ribbon topoisomerase 1